MAELQTCLADGRVVHNREKSRRVRHDGSIEERFIVVEQIDQVDVAFQIGGLLRELQIHALQLEFLGLRYVRNEPNKTECLLFGLGEGGRLVERWIVKQFDSALGSASHFCFPLFRFFKSGPVILYLTIRQQRSPHRM